MPHKPGFALTDRAALSILAFGAGRLAFFAFFRARVRVVALWAVAGARAIVRLRVIALAANARISDRSKLVVHCLVAGLAHIVRAGEAPLDAVFAGFVGGLRIGPWRALHVAVIFVPIGVISGANQTVVGGYFANAALVRALYAMIARYEVVV